MRSLLSERFSTEDIVGFLIARQIPQWEREKKDVEASFDLLLSTFNKTVLKVEFGLGEDGWLTRKQFLAWYRKRTGVEFCVSRRDGSGCSTYSSNHAEDSFMTRLARAMGRVRERSIQQTIAESLEVKRRVLVVYGGNHYLEERAFLAEQLGKPCMER
ncbi:MAG: hypothetical protein HYV97_01175 [Bdellovibrio sp.]|nr:hypothetical protein [Bdellovibrio sp.]